MFVTGLLCALAFALTTYDAYTTSKRDADNLYDTAIENAEFVARNIEFQLDSSNYHTINITLNTFIKRGLVSSVEVIDVDTEFRFNGGNQNDYTFYGTLPSEAIGIFKGANRTVDADHTSINVYEPLLSDGNTIGVLIMKVEKKSILALIWDKSRTRSIAIIPFLLISSLLTYFMARQLSRPVQILSSCATDVASGDMEAKIPSVGTTETRILGNAMTYMLAQLKESIDKTQSLAAEAERSAEEARLASKSKSEFLANMSHEIRTPMNGVVGISEILLKTDLDSKQKELAGIIMSSGNSLITIINDILDFSKIEAGKMRLLPEPFNLRTSIQDVMALISTRAREKDLELLVEYEPHLPEGFDGDAGRIRQIITNLVGNAVKFTEKGQVSVKVSGFTADKEAHLRFEVSDTGIGIAHSKIGKMFEQFEQADTTSTRKYQGTGIGLAISKSLIELMGGRIGATSTLGEGSTFWFEIALPINNSVTEGRYADTSALEGLHLLIVDDNADNRKILTDQVESWGITSQTAASAAAALDLYKEQKETGKPFDIVITDYNMPHMNGVEFTETLSSQGYGHTGPILMLSSLSERSEAAENTRDMFDMWLTKPVRTSQLLDALTTSLYNSGIQELRDVHKKLEEIASSQTSNQAEEAETQSPKLKVLVAEDNIVNQMVIKTMLEALNANVILTENGIEAVKRFKQDKPDIVVMDVSMPEMDGYQATRSIRAFERDNALERTPVLAATAHVMEEDHRKCLNAGMDAVITKPIKQDIVEAALIKWVPQHFPDQNIEEEQPRSA